MNKYQEALDWLKNQACEDAIKCDDCDINGICDYQKNVDERYSLLQELVDNPPLKFEDLKEGMWVWDNKNKSYIYIFKPLVWEPVKGIRYASHIITNSAEGYHMGFEENRFYRWEVSQGGQKNE